MEQGLEVWDARCHDILPCPEAAEVGVPHATPPSIGLCEPPALSGSKEPAHGIVAVVHDPLVFQVDTQSGGRRASNLLNAASHGVPAKPGPRLTGQGLQTPSVVGFAISQDAGSTYIPPPRPYQLHTTAADRCSSRPFPARKTGQRKAEPLFYCYPFACFDAIRVYPLICWTPGLRCVVEVGRQLTTVPDVVIPSTRKRIAEIGEVSDHSPRLIQGDQVTTTARTLSDLSTTFDQPLSSQERARVLVEFVGRCTPCEVFLDGLETVR
jgi:transcription antitermination factor NusG